MRNAICDVVVLGCYSGKRRRIKAGIVERAVVERKMDGFNEISCRSVVGRSCLLRRGWVDGLSAVLVEVIDDVEDRRKGSNSTQRSMEQSNEHTESNRDPVWESALSAGSEWQPTHTSSGGQAGLTTSPPVTRPLSCVKASEGPGPD